MGFYCYRLSDGESRLYKMHGMSVGGGMEDLVAALNQAAGTEVSNLDLDFEVRAGNLYPFLGRSSDSSRIAANWMLRLHGGGGWFLNLRFLH
ncbi:hypothetical protein [Tychonema sp. LEGE 07203]|uniref:hypothetical protein n=1 Tax=Tychonema sp. LEGE 07203 TaxID=1828671 RepID=UPI00187FCE80|nr:hypothetical protein [Tychonema sp. LEGE 07203]MBE9094107.1 hypothetical protein [Tychonema sp. LEGE 07203]